MTVASKRVVFTMGGKGGVGKTGFVVALAEWFSANDVPITLLDLDTENKARGSLKHFFNGTVTKVNVHTPAGLDTFIDHLDDGAPISRLKVPTEKFPIHLKNGNSYEAALPCNPYAKGKKKVPVILVPIDILRDLPVAADWEDVSKAAAENAEIRGRVGIPDSVEFATKPELARRMIGCALDSGATAAWVAADEVERRLTLLV